MPQNSCTTLLQTQWANELCPMVSGITFGNGDIHRISIDSLQISGAKYEYRFEYLQGTTMEEAGHIQELKWAHVTTLCQCAVPERDLLLVAAEGSYGSEGIVAATRLSDGLVEWIAYFEDSNPFVGVKCVDDHVLATSNMGNVWVFSLDPPLLVTIDVPDR